MYGQAVGEYCLRIAQSGVVWVRRIAWPGIARHAWIVGVRASTATLRHDSPSALRRPFQGHPCRPSMPPPPPLQVWQLAWLTPPMALAWRTGIMLGICRDGIGMLFRCERMLFMRALLAIIICCCWLGIEAGSRCCWYACIALDDSPCESSGEALSVADASWTCSSPLDFESLCDRELAFDSRHALDLLGQANSCHPLFRAGYFAFQAGHAIVIFHTNFVIVQLAALFELTADSVGHLLLSGRLGHR